MFSIQVVEYTQTCRWFGRIGTKGRDRPSDTLNNVGQPGPATLAFHYELVVGGGIEWARIHVVAGFQIDLIVQRLALGKAATGNTWQRSSIDQAVST